MKAENIFKGDGKQINTKFFSRLKDRAKKNNQEIGATYDLTQSFYEGDQWESLKTFVAGYSAEKKLLYDRFGETIWAFNNNNVQEQESKYAKRVVNYLKPYTDTQVAAHAEVDPKPIAIPRATYLKNDDKLKTINVALDQIFAINNKFIQHFQTAIRQAYLHSYHITQIYVDNINMDKQGDCPIKFAHVNMRDFWVDPEASDIDNAEYTIQKIKIPKLILENKYDYKYETTEEDVNEFDLQEIFVYWLKIETVKKDEKVFKNKRIPKTVWLQITTLDDQWIKRKDSEGNVVNGIENYIVKTFPFVLWRANITEKYHGGMSKGEESIELQVQMNKLMSAVDYNTRLYIDPPVQGKGNSQLWKDGNMPGGIITLKTDSGYTPITVNLLEPATINAIRQYIKDGFNLIFGNVDLMEGHNPKGTYSGSHLQNLLSLTKLKPKLIEHGFMSTIKDLAEKSLRVWAETMSAAGVILYNPESEDNIHLTPSIIEDQLYRIDVIITDANLMSNEAKLNKVLELMQYGKFDISIYEVMLLFNNSMPGFFSDEMLEASQKTSELEGNLKDLQLEGQSKQTKMQIKQMEQQGSKQGEPTIEQITERAKDKAGELGIDPAQIDNIVAQSQQAGADNNALINTLEQFLSKGKGIAK